LASGMISLRIGCGSSDGGNGILGSGDDRGDSKDGNGDRGVGAATQLSTNASMDAGREV
ncbi:hypothetical protein Tco_0353814, partial [Tanacetum coccineum]